MLTEPTMQKLYQMRLHGMAEAFRKQLEDPQATELAFEDRFGMLVESQYLWKETRALTRRLSLAKLRVLAVLEDIDFRHPRGLERARFLSLAHESRWVRSKHNLILTGPTGIGKTYLACALAQKACRDGFSALYKRVPELYRELRASHADGSFGKLLKKLARVDVLVLDDFCMNPMTESERRDLLEICDDRFDLRSTLLASQLPPPAWHEQVGDATVADSILDRLVHHAHRFELSGESLRRVQGQERLSEAAGQSAGGVS